MQDSSKTEKGAQTRQTILDVALRLFQENGYQKTSMRMIAKEAGVSVGNAYYYFSSKEHLVQGFYARLHEEHLEIVLPALEGKKKFADRLRIMLETKVETAAPYHEFSGLLFRTAADPKSPLNPFSPASREVREDATELARKVLFESTQKIPKGMETDLPNLIWLYEMAVVLFWIHDDSEGFSRSYKLIARSSEIVARLVGLLANPLLAPVRKQAIGLLEDLAAPSRILERFEPPA